MTKETAHMIIDKLKANNIEKILIRYENANRFTITKTDTSHIYFAPDYIVVLETSNNYGNPNARFNVRFIDYGSVETITANELNVADAIKLLKSEGCYDEDMQNIIKKRGGKVTITPTLINTSSYAEEYETVVDEETGKVKKVTVIKGDQPGRITTGSSK
jgi:hypothetical protein